MFLNLLLSGKVWDKKPAKRSVDGFSSLFGPRQVRVRPADVAEDVLIRRQRMVDVPCVLAYSYRFI